MFYLTIHTFNDEFIGLCDEFNRFAIIVSKEFWHDRKCIKLYLLLNNKFPCAIYPCMLSTYNAFQL